MKLLIPGPVELSDATRREASRQMVSHRGAEFKQINFLLDRGMRQILGTGQPVYSITGSGTAAVEFLAANLIEKNDVVVSLANGKFGERFADIARVYSDNVVEKSVEWGEPLDYGTGKADVVTMVQNETSTGVQNSVEIARRLYPDALLLADAVSALGNEVNVDKQGIDGVATATQKALGAPPGMAFASLSKRAQEKALAIKRAPYYLRFELYKKAAEKSETPFTPAEPIAFAAASRIAEINAEGMKRFIERHWQNADFVRKRVREMGFALFPKRGATPSNVVTAIETPLAEEVREKMKQKDFLLSGGQEHLKGKIFRIAHMGETTQEELAECLNALEEATVRMPITAK